ncbi:hypothetical protein Tco_0893488 [Tanacetum coccineum]|uniref:Uncharacterized protein n=1 Tax=Tanacetum coccineum TaxID=301880 RepID=A0ABQ5CC96_9ASTR
MFSRTPFSRFHRSPSFDYHRLKKHKSSTYQIEEPPSFDLCKKVAFLYQIDEPPSVSIYPGTDSSGRVVFSCRSYNVRQDIRRRQQQKFDGFWGLLMFLLIARIKVHELSKSKVDLSAQLRDLKLKLALLRVAKITRGDIRRHFTSEHRKGNVVEAVAARITYRLRRKDLRVNEEVVSKESRDSVDARCRKLLASWVRDMAVSNKSSRCLSFMRGLKTAGVGRFCSLVFILCRYLENTHKNRLYCPLVFILCMVFERKTTVNESTGIKKRSTSGEEELYLL